MPVWLCYPDGMKILPLFLIVLSLISTTSFAGESRRYYFEGDGTVKIASAKNGKSGTFVYRDPKGGYDLGTFDRINGVFDLKTMPDEFTLEHGPFGVHPRLIALLDYLQDELKGGKIVIKSGYRSPTYNEGLRKKGKLAAKTSMHIEGMAADIELEGVDGKKLWEYVRSLDCCGAGYYQGKGIHIDVGPSRFWDEKTTGVEKDLGSHNKLLMLRTNFDVYRPGERVYTILGRITDYPVNVKPNVSIENSKGKSLATAAIDVKDLKQANGCLILPSRAAARSLEFDLPNGIKNEDKIAVRMELCDKEFPEMPDSVLSNVFAVKQLSN